MVKTNRKMIKPFMVGFPHQTVGLQEGLVALFLMIPMISAQPTAFRQGSVAVLGLSEPVITNRVPSNGDFIMKIPIQWI